MEFGSQQAFCPRCGRSDEVQTVRELFDLLNTLQDAAIAQAQQARYSQPGPHQRRNDWDSDQGSYADPGQDIADAVLGSATALIGRAIGKRMRRTFDEKIGPALQGRAEQSVQQSRLEQDAIVQQHPDLRGCMRDQVIFLAGGSNTMPMSDIPMPITAAQADVLIGRPRGY